MYANILCQPFDKYVTPSNIYIFKQKVQEPFVLKILANDTYFYLTKLGQPMEIVLIVLDGLCKHQQPEVGLKLHNNKHFFSNLIFAFAKL